MNACNYWCNEKKHTFTHLCDVIRFGKILVCMCEPTELIFKCTINCIEFSIIIDFHSLTSISSQWEFDAQQYEIQLKNWTAKNGKNLIDGCMDDDVVVFSSSLLLMLKQCRDFDVLRLNIYLCCGLWIVDCDMLAEFILPICAFGFYVMNKNRLHQITCSVKLLYTNEKKKDLIDYVVIR